MPLAVECLFKYLSSLKSVWLYLAYRETIQGFRTRRISSGSDWERRASYSRAVVVGVHLGNDWLRLRDDGDFR